MSQVERVKNYLQQHGKIDKDIARNKLKVGRLSARILNIREELEGKPQKIKTKTVKGENEYGTFEYAEYHWIDPTKQEQSTMFPTKHQGAYSR